MRFLILLTYLLYLVPELLANDDSNEPSIEESKFQLAKSYLCRYGYMNKNLCYSRTQSANQFLRHHAKQMRKGLILFEEMFNLPSKGKISSEHIVKMGSPRCGNQDIEIRSKKFRIKKIDYTKLFRKGENKISYSLRNYNFYSQKFAKTVSNEIIDQQIQKAFKVWFDHLNSNITIEKLKASYEYFRSTDKGNVTFLFAERRHGDSLNFDGPHGEIAHASSLYSKSSIFRGHVHLDDEEDWHTDNKLLVTLTHEIGHLFGLNHSSNPDSVMSPIYNFKSDNLLDDQDIDNFKRSLSIIPSKQEKTTKAPIKLIEKKLSMLEKLIQQLNSIKNKSNNSIKTSTSSKSSTSTTTSTTTTIVTTSTSTTTSTKNEQKFEFSFLKDSTKIAVLPIENNNSDIEYQSILRLLALPAKLILKNDSPNAKIVSKIEKSELDNELGKYSKQITFDNLCGKNSKIDAITRTEFGNSFVLKENLIWHIKGLTNWRIVDYDGWPKKITQIFADLSDNIDSAYFTQNHYFFTKGELIWKYKVNEKKLFDYKLVSGYPKLLAIEFPKIPFKSVDSAFSIGESVFFFKDFLFWQSSWTSNTMRSVPFKTHAAISWKNPSEDLDFNEPLAYLVSGSAMHHFNFWNVYLQEKNFDLRYFLFDCLETNSKPKANVYMGPSFKNQK